jgi:hypothetical protein
MPFNWLRRSFASGTTGCREAIMEERIPDGASPFEEHDCGHLPCPPWLKDEEAAPQAVAPRPQAPQREEPELDPPHHLHGLWAALGLGDE